MSAVSAIQLVDSVVAVQSLASVILYRQLLYRAGRQLLYRAYRVLKDNYYTELVDSMMRAVKNNSLLGYTALCHFASVFHEFLYKG